tara:strand:- start:616 stop:1569 length:954 start_codon:yes stop_codon:yes gene_type:complete
MNKRRSFIIGIKSYKLSSREKKFLKLYKPWGVILFSRNIKSIKQCSILTNSIRDIFKDKFYPILIDEEGGKVSRLSKIINTSVFKAQFFGDLFLSNKNKFNTYSKVYIEQMSYLLKQMGININTVPVLDVRRTKSNKIIGSRSFSTNPKIVSKIGDIFINLYQKNNIGTVIKHIPGHGLAKVDSHKMTPTVFDSLDKLNKNDFFPFKNKKSLFCMTAHIKYNKIDKSLTATHSSKIINLIRKKIKFRNIIMTDDISMRSLKFRIAKNTTLAFKAGCNLVLHCNSNYSEMLQVADNSPQISNFLIKKTSEFYNILKKN